MPINYRGGRNLENMSAMTLHQLCTVGNLKHASITGLHYNLTSAKFNAFRTRKSINPEHFSHILSDNKLHIGTKQMLVNFQDDLGTHLPCPARHQWRRSRDG